MKVALFTLAMLCSSTLLAQPQIPYQPEGTNRDEALGVVLDASPLNGSDLTFATNSSAGANSKAIRRGAGRGYNLLVMEVFFNHTATAGAITTTCKVGNYADDISYSPGVCDVSSSGVCTVGVSGGTFTTASLSADTKWTQRLNISGYSEFSCVVSHGGSPGSSDTITVQATLVAE